MTDLATRIADVKKATHNLECCGRSTCSEAAALIRNMAARIKELQAKADDWQTMKDELGMARANYQHLEQDTDNEIAEFRKRNEELEKALEPFALAASAYDKCKPTRPMRFVWEFDKTLEVGHLRTAARALKGEADS
jgi:DNA repair exonuclease SbcCD ATPase subunit